MGFKDLIFGKVEFCVRDGFCELFLRSCKESGIVLYEVSASGNTINAFVRQYDVRHLIACAEKSGMQLDIIRRSGIPDLFFRYRRRLGVPAGLMSFILILLVLRSFIWSINISGLENIPEDEILLHLEEMGIKAGQFCENISCRDAEFSIYKAFEDVNWVNVRVSGTRLFVSISEVKVNEEYKEDIFSNIVAARDGEIVRADIFSGEGKIYPGTAVVKGDLLVSGVKTHRDGSVEFVDSNARILARTRNFIASTVPLEITVSRAVECKDVYLPTFFGFNLSELISVKGSYLTKSSSFFRSGDVTYPVGLIRIRSCNMTEEKISLTEPQALLIAFRDFSLNTLKLYERVQVSDIDFSVSFAQYCEISAVFVCEEDIAYKKSFTVNSEN